MPHLCRTLKFAAKSGHLKCLKKRYITYKYDMAESPNDQTSWAWNNLMYCLASIGNLECLVWAHDKGFPIRDRHYPHYEAARWGNLECLIWLCEICPIPEMNNHITRAAISGNSINCLKWLFENKMLSSKYLLYETTRTGAFFSDYQKNIRCIQFALDMGSKWATNTWPVDVDIKNQYFYERANRIGCAGSEVTNAIDWNNHNLLRFAINNGAKYKTHVGHESINSSTNPQSHLYAEGFGF
jgi:hypothetical protein